MIRALCVLALLAGSAAAAPGDGTDDIELMSVITSCDQVGGDNLVCPSGQMQCGNTEFCIPTGANCCDLRGTYCPQGYACDGQGHCISTAPPPSSGGSARSSCDASGGGTGLFVSLAVALALFLPRRKAAA